MNYTATLTVCVCVCVETKDHDVCAVCLITWTPFFSLFYLVLLNDFSQLCGSLGPLAHLNADLFKTSVLNLTEVNP